MPLETYIPSEITFRGQDVEEVVLVTLYDPETPQARGAITAGRPLPPGERGGPLVFRGRRDGKWWRVTIGEIEVRNRSAVGFEFSIFSGVQREMEGEAPESRAKSAPDRLENLGATF